VRVPEAAVDKDERPMPGQLEVWAAGEARAVRAVSVAAREESCADEELGLGIRSTDARHNAAAELGAEGVHFPSHWR